MNVPPQEHPPLLMGQGSPVGAPERSNQEIADRQWAEAALSGEKRVLELIAGGEGLPVILEALCRAVEGVCRDSLCSIGLLDGNGKRLLIAAAPGFPGTFIDLFNNHEIAACWGPCAAAAYHNEQVIAADFEMDPRWTRCREMMSLHGVRACWSTPILSSEGKVLGTFAVSSRRPCSPSPRHQDLIRQFTHLATIAIERIGREEALRRSEAYLAEAQKLSQTGSFGWKVSTGELFWSAETFNILGYSPVLKPTLELVLERVHPEDVALVQRMISVASHQMTNLDFEHRVVMPGGAVKHLHVIAHAAKDGSGEIEFIGAVMDVTQRKRAESRATGEKQLLEMIAKGGDLPSILKALSRYGEELSGNVLVSILLVSRDGKSLRHGAAPSLPSAYTEAIDGALVGPSAGSCGAAVFRREPVIVSDISTDPLWENYRHLALPHGLRACWSTPIFSTDREVVGTFALYSREVGVPTSEQRAIIEQITHLAAVAIERERAEAALRRSESRFQGILEIADDAILSVNAGQRIVLYNQGAEKVFGYVAAEVIGQPIDILIPERFNLAHRSHLKQFGQALEVSRTMAERREVYGRRKDGVEFPAEASISKLTLGEEVLFTVILRDITERKQAAEALHAAAQLARGQAEALTRTLDALSKESAPDKLVEHVLRTITQQLEAQSSSVWLRDEDTGLVRFEFAFEQGRLLTGADAALARISPSLRIDEVSPWPQVFRTGKPSVLEDIREGPAFPWRDHLLSLGVVTVLVVPMLIAGDVNGIVGIRFTRKRSFRAEEIDLAQALAHQAMLACQLGRLSRQSRQAAVVAERNRLARDIHDTLAQGFTGVIVQLEAVEEAMSKGLVIEAGECLTRAGALARESLQEARRSVRALRPQSLEETDLCEALHQLVCRMTTGTVLKARFDVWGQSPELPQEWEDNLLRISQEVLTNVLRHAQAREFKARLDFERKMVRLRFTDDGQGFDPQARHEGFGLRGIRERVQVMGGGLDIQSTRNQGTVITIVLPFPEIQHTL